ncbi:MAG TPA: hypothetical protein VF889_04180 [Bacteroidota bacterium]
MSRISLPRLVRALLAAALLLLPVACKHPMPTAPDDAVSGNVGQAYANPGFPGAPRLAREGRDSAYRAPSSNRQLSIDH